MKLAYMLLRVDPAVNTVGCSWKTDNIEPNHMAVIAWKLEQYAANPTLYKSQPQAGEFRGEPYGETEQIAIFSFMDDELTMELHGKKLSPFHAVSAAAVLRMSATSGLMQTLVVQGVMQAFAMVQQQQAEKPLVDKILQGVRRN